MGVKLTDIIPRREISFEELANKKIAIDFSNCLYQFLSSIRQPDGALLMDSKGNVTSHLMGIWNRFSNLIQKDIKLIVVFDGESPELKMREKMRRAEIKIAAEEKYKKAVENEDIENMNKFAKRMTKVNKGMFEESKELIKAMGLPIIQAPSESDAQMAFMNEKGDVWACATTDFDPLLHGAPRVVSNLTISQKRKLPSGGYVISKPYLTELDKILRELELNQDQLIALAMLVGSVDHNEPTIIKNAGIIKVNPIGECPIDLPLEVPCFDTKTKKITFKNVKKFIKHTINEPLYEITTAYNRKVRVTKSHSLFIKTNKGIETVKTTDLKKGDQLVVPVKIPQQNKVIKKINFIKELWEHKDKIKRLIYCDGKNVQKICKKRLLNKKGAHSENRYALTKYGIQKLKRLRINNKLTLTKMPLSRTTLYDWEKDQRDPTETKFKDYLNFLGTNLKEFNEENKSIKKIRGSVFEEEIFPRMNYRNKYRKTLLFKTLSKEEVNLLSRQDFLYSRTKSCNAVPSVLKITPELIRLIGYFLAEGHLNSNYRINFSFALEGNGHDNYCVDDVIYCIKKVFKTKPKIYHEKSTRHVCLDNCVIHDFFAYILGLEKQNSKTKKIPSLIFNINSKLQLEFLKALFLGDGSLNKNHISFNTASYDMAVGISYILLQQGIIFSTSFQNKKNYNMKVISICGKDQLMKVKRIWGKHHKAKIIINHCKKFLRRTSCMEIDGDLGYVKIKSINKVKPSNKYVYDFSVDGENFIAGFGGVCCHNTDYNEGVRGVGPKTALRLVKETRDFDKLFKDVKAEFNWKKVYATFKSMPIMKNYQLKWNEPDVKKIKSILVDKHEFSEERVNNTLAKLKVEKKAQKGLNEFF